MEKHGAKQQSERRAVGQNLMLDRFAPSKKEMEAMAAS